MLAQNFKTPANLKITDAEFDAFVKVLGMLERGEMEYHTAERMDSYNFAEFVPQFFNMRFFAGVGACGTVACICGWVEYVGRLKKDSLVMKRFHAPGMDALFDPSGAGFSMNEITMDQAAIALRNYLTHGEPRWAEALA